MAQVPRKDIPPEDLARVRQAAEDYLRSNIDGSPSSIRVVFTTHEIARTVISGGPGAPTLDPPDERPVYVVVFEGDFRTRTSGRRGCWLAVDVTPAFGVLGYRLAPPEAERIVNLDLNELGRVHSIDLDGRSDT